MHEMLMQEEAGCACMADPNLNELRRLSHKLPVLGSVASRLKRARVAGRESEEIARLKAQQHQVYSNLCLCTPRMSTHFALLPICGRSGSAQTRWASTCSDDSARGCASTSANASAT